MDYYNPSINEYVSRQKPTDDMPDGCLWQILILILLGILFLCL